MTDVEGAGAAEVGDVEVGDIEVEGIEIEGTEPEVLGDIGQDVFAEGDPDFLDEGFLSPDDEPADMTEPS